MTARCRLITTCQVIYMSTTEDRERQVGVLLEMFDRVCRKIEPKVYESGNLIWYNITGEDRFDISFPDTDGLREIHHVVRIPKTDGYESDDKTDIVAYVDEDVEHVTMIGTGVLPNHKTLYRNEVAITDTLERTAVLVFNALLLVDR